MLNELITSKTRFRLLLKFFLNPDNKSYLRNLEREFEESTNSIRVELNKLENLKLLNSSIEGNKKVFQVNISHNFFPDIRNMLLKEFGLDLVKLLLTQRIKGLHDIYVLNNQSLEEKIIIYLILVGENLNANEVKPTIDDIELVIKKQIGFLVMDNESQSRFLDRTKYIKL